MKRKLKQKNSVLLVGLRLVEQLILNSHKTYDSIESNVIYYKLIPVRVVFEHWHCPFSFRFKWMCSLFHCLRKKKTDIEQDKRHLEQEMDWICRIPQIQRNDIIMRLRAYKKSVQHELVPWKQHLAPRSHGKGSDTWERRKRSSTFIAFFANPASACYRFRLHCVYSNALRFKTASAVCVEQGLSLLCSWARLFPLSLSRVARFNQRCKSSTE